jgi:hypothetical protein
MHLVLVYNPSAGSSSVYTNGVLMIQNSGVTVPMSALLDMHSYLGKSSYSSDPNGVATVDEFRIYSGAISQSQITADYLAGPNTLPTDPPPLSIEHVGTDIVLSWPAYAAGFDLQTCAELGTNAGWNALPGSPTPAFSNNNYQVTLPLTNQTAFYRLAN